MFKYKIKSSLYVYRQGNIYKVSRMFNCFGSLFDPLLEFLLNLYDRRFPLSRDDAFPVAVMSGFACNLSCSYCYQWDRLGLEKPSIPHSSKLSPRDLADMIFEHSNLSSIDLSFLGGEPMLYLDYLTDLLYFLRLKTVVKGVGLITNGTILTDSILDQMVELGVDNVQVSIDGARSEHDRYRSLKSGKGTYSHVLNNIVRFSNHIPSVSVRVNLMSENINGLSDLLVDLSQNDELNKESIVLVFVQLIQRHRLMLLLLIGEIFYVPRLELFPKQRVMVLRLKFKIMWIHV